MSGERPPVRNVGYLFASSENTSGMKDAVAHSGMEAAKLNGLFLHSSRLPLSFIETRPASSQIVHTLLASSSRFSVVEADLKTENEFAWSAPPTVSQSGVLLGPACPAVYQNIFGQHRHHTLLMLKA